MAIQLISRSAGGAAANADSGFINPLIGLPNPNLGWQLASDANPFSPDIRGQSKTGGDGATATPLARDRKSSFYSDPKPRKNSTRRSFVAAGRSCWIQWPQPGSTVSPR